MGRDSEYPLTFELEANLTILLEALNKFRAIYGKPMYVSSGYRPGKYNTAAGGAAHSNHMVCMACDFHDANEDLDTFCLANQAVLADCGLWLESPTHTPGWCHLDTHSRANRVFNP